MEATSIDGLVAHCQSGRFTGILRMRAHEGIGEVWFLSGVADEVHFGTSTADEAMERMRKATDATYELVARLPHPGGGFKKRFPAKGSIASATPVTLMRYCEQYALTCTLAVQSKDVLVEAKYELGELVSVETTADDDGITAMLEAQDGMYEFTLPRVELPAGTPVLPPASGLVESIPPPEAVAIQVLLESKPPVGRPASDEAEVKRKTVEIARQQKSAAASPKPAPAKSPAQPAVAKKAEPKAAAKTPPRPAVAKKAEPKPAEPPRVEEKPEPAKAPEPEIAAEAQATRAPAAPPAEAPPAEEKRAEPEPKEEPKPAAPPVAEPREDERVAAPKRDEPAEEPAGVPAKPSMTWVVAPLLILAAVAYLWWTHRF